jgi:hypothetical protein
MRPKLFPFLFLSPGCAASIITTGPGEGLEVGERLCRSNITSLLMARPDFALSTCRNSPLDNVLVKRDMRTSEVKPLVTEKE